MSYEKTQWKAFEDILSNQRKNLDNYESLIQIFEMILTLDNEYLEGLCQIEERVNKLNTFGSLGKSFNMFKKYIDTKKKEMAKVCSVITPLFNLKEHTELLNEQIRRQYENQREEIEFHEVTKCIMKEKEKYHKCLEEIEMLYTELIEKRDQNLNIDGEFEKCKADYLTMEKMAKQIYCENITEGNTSHKKYEQSINQILNDCQKFDEKYIDICQSKLQLYFDSEVTAMTEIRTIAEECEEVCKNADISADINEFCTKNKRHGHPPECFDFEPYPIKNNYFKSTYPKAKIHEFQTDIKEFYKQYFGYFPPEGINDVTIVRKYKALERYVISAWLGDLKEDDLKTLEEFIQQKKMRIRFLKFINNYRINLEPLNDDSYKIITQIMKMILHETLLTQPYEYESINLVLILSQTFYKKTVDNQQVFLQVEIMKEDMWQRKDIWEGLIFHSFQCNMIRDKSLLPSIDDRTAKEKTTMLIALTTFLFIMKSFNFGKDVIKEIVSSYCQKYGIDEDMVKSHD